MARRIRRKNRKRQNRRNQTETVEPITEAQVGELREWLARMQTHLGKAIALSEQLDRNAPSEDDDSFWALVKYAENVQECAVQLDNMKRSILEALEEVPMISEQGTELNWSGLKGMRSRLAHSFWDIDREILWDTVTNDLPVLRTLLSLLFVTDRVADPESPLFTVPPEDLEYLPLSKEDDEFTLGNSFIFMSFNPKGRARCARVKRVGDKEFMVKPPGDVDGFKLLVSRVTGEQRKHLGYFENMPNPRPAGKTGGGA